MVEQVYRPRRPKESPLWQCLCAQFDTFLDVYEERYQPRYGFLRPIIPEVVDKFLSCADLKQGFARIRCENCKHEFILPYSCRQRYFCPSCHQKSKIPAAKRVGEGAALRRAADRDHPVPGPTPSPHAGHPENAAPLFP